MKILICHWRQQISTSSEKKGRGKKIRPTIAERRKKEERKRARALTSDEAAQGNIGPGLTVNCSLRHLDLRLKNIKSVKQM